MCTTRVSKQSFILHSSNIPDHHGGPILSFNLTILHKNTFEIRVNNFFTRKNRNFRTASLRMTSDVSDVNSNHVNCSVWKYSLSLSFIKVAIQHYNFYVKDNNQVALTYFHCVPYIFSFTRLFKKPCTHKTHI